METFAVAEVCRRRGARFLAVRIVIDAVDDELDDVELDGSNPTILYAYGGFGGAPNKVQSRSEWQKMQPNTAVAR